MTRTQPADSLDLRGTPCPLNWVKTRLRLEAMAPGQTLEIWLDDGDAIRNVPRSAKTEGHRILEIRPIDGAFLVVVERA